MINFDEDSDLKGGNDNSGAVGDNDLNENSGEEEDGEDDVDSWELESDLEE